MQAEIEHLKLHLPVIALDGAILYDVPKNELLCTYPLSQTLGTKITQLLDDKHLNYFYHVLKDDVLLTYYNSFDQSEQMDYYDMKIILKACAYLRFFLMTPLQKTCWKD